MLSLLTNFLKVIEISYITAHFFEENILYISCAEIAQLVSKFRSGPIGFSTCGHKGAHSVARVGTTSNYDRQDYFQIFYYGRDIVVTILILKCQKQRVHGEFGSTESLVRFLISALPGVLVEVCRFFQ